MRFKIAEYGPAATSPLGLYYSDYETVYGDTIEASVVNQVPPVTGNYDASVTISFAGIYKVELEVYG